MAEAPAKNSILKVILPVAVIVVAAILALSLLKKQGGGAKHSAVAQEGQTIEDISLARFQGAQTRLSEFKGKVFLVNFWASWCSACMIEMPSIVRLWNEFKGQGLEVLAVNVDENPTAVVPGLTKKLMMEFPILVDPENRLADIFDVHAIPTTVVLDRNRKVLLIDSGERNWNGADVHEQMKRWLAEK